ncbi:unnamed protein product [Cyclocybe aegerita]|uniref:F-box domain-containing protein n=1 Tax=Cyclocybe aegerita TaxID=1973307 RepID=A0A8S0W592_CYCAE|nr:unnamed protein product [Cyclocybe aegerita]
MRLISRLKQLKLLKFFEKKADTRPRLCQRIPLEIWSEIFQYLPLGVPIFMNVCKTWRQAALSSPRLWTDIMANVDDDAYVETIEARLSRSGALGVHVALFRGDVSVGGVDIKDRLKATPEKERWKSLYFDSPSFIRPLLDIKNGTRWDMLQELIMDVKDEQVDIENEPFDITHLRALRFLTIRAIGGVSVNTFRVPWNQLAFLHLHLTWSQAADLLPIVQRSINVVLCVIVLEGASIGNNLEPPPSYPRVRQQMPKMQGLFLNGADTMTPLLSYLSAPSLHILSITSRRFLYDRHSEAYFPGSDIACFVSASRCKLTVLELHGINMRFKDVLVCFEALQHLFLLKVTNRGVAPVLTGQVLLELARRTAHPDVVLLPKLRILLVYTPAFVLSHADCMEFLKSRRNKGSPRHVSPLQRIERYVFRKAVSDSTEGEQLSSDRDTFTSDAVMSNLNCFSHFATLLEEAGLPFRKTFTLITS